jgi:nucleoside-diphosphate-sugar epimerase
MKKVVITGSDGYIGKNLITFLPKEKFKIYKVDILNGKIFDLLSKNLHKKIPMHSTVVHLAALSQDKLCKKNPIYAYEQNFLGTLNLIKACNKKKVVKFIYASTEWIYPSTKKNKIQNDSDLVIVDQLESIYGKTKYFCEHIIKDCLLAKDKIILRFGIIYGNKKKNLSVLERLCHDVEENKKIVVMSKKTLRRFIHIEDLCRGIIKSFKFKGLKILNLTGKKAVTIEQIVNKLSKIYNKKILIIEKNKKNPNIRNVKTSEVFSATNYINLKKGLKKIISNFNND